MKRKLRSRNGVLAGGNWIVDQVKMIDVLPQAEQLANIVGYFQGTGGAPYNVLVDLARLGAPFPLFAAGLVGDDVLGRQILSDCRAYKIDIRHLRTTGLAPTSYTDVMTERGSGRRTFFHHRGANALWNGDGIDFRRVPARIFHLGYLLLLDAIDKPDTTYGTRAAALLRAAQEAGMKTSIDVVSEESDRHRQIVMPALRYVDYCIINEVEAGKITGFNTRAANGVLNPVSIRHAAGALLQGGVRELVVIHFPEGAFARARQGVDLWQSSVKVREIAGTAGAGDAFAAGVLMGLHEGWTLERSLYTGACVAAVSLSHPTCTSGIKSLASALKFGRKLGFRPSICG